MAFSLSSLMTYAESWVPVSEELLSNIDPNGFEEIISAHVMSKEQEWGTSTSICLMLKSSGRKYIPLSNKSDLKVGDEVDVNSLKVIELERGGEVCYKADGNALQAEE